MPDDYTIVVQELGCANSFAATTIGFTVTIDPAALDFAQSFAATGVSGVLAVAEMGHTLSFDNVTVTATAVNRTIVPAEMGFSASWAATAIPENQTLAVDDMRCVSDFGGVPNRTIRPADMKFSTTIAA